MTGSVCGTPYPLFGLELGVKFGLVLCLKLVGPIFGLDLGGVKFGIEDGTKLGLGFEIDGSTKFVGLELGFEN